MEDISNKNFYIVLNGDELNLLAAIFDIAVRAKGLEIALSTGQLLDKIQKNIVEIPQTEKSTI